MRLPRHLAVALSAALWLFQAGAAAQEAQPEQEQEAPRQEKVKQPGLAEQEDLFPLGQIEQLVAPIALYPDALLAQILMAATYPLDIVQAVRWQQDHKDLEGDALQEAAEAEPWDQSVKTLVFFPSVLEYMNDNLDWTQDLGDAVLGQQDDVMESVQHLRAEAQQAGTLETTERQRVETEGYLFRSLAKKGKHAPGGTRDYINDDGHQTQGFALLAYPAEYGQSGIMTFMVNHLGVIFQKDLGDDTLTLVAAITAYDPDDSWSLVTD